MFPVSFCTTFQSEDERERERASERASERERWGEGEGAVAVPRGEPLSHRDNLETKRRAERKKECMRIEVDKCEWITRDIGVPQWQHARYEREEERTRVAKRTAALIEEERARVEEERSCLLQLRYAVYVLYCCFASTDSFLWQERRENEDPGEYEKAGTACSNCTSPAALDSMMLDMLCSHTTKHISFACNSCNTSGV
jgi:hypothetical protein